MYYYWFLTRVKRNYTRSGFDPDPQRTVCGVMLVLTAKGSDAFRGGEEAKRGKRRRRHFRLQDSSGS